MSSAGAGADADTGADRHNHRDRAKQSDATTRAASAGSPPPGERAGRPSSPTLGAGYHDLLDALAQAGCAICRLAAAAADLYLDAWAYENFTDLGVRAALVTAGGFCTTHTWQLADLHASFQLAVAYRDILARAAGTSADGSRAAERPAANVREAGTDTPWWQRLLALHPTRPGRSAAVAVEEAAAGRWRRCPACRARADEETRALHAFATAGAAHDPAFRMAFESSSGCCLLHIRGARDACHQARASGEVLNWLESAQRQCLERALAQIGELIRKHDYRFRHEPQGEEMRSWQLAAGLVAGRRGVW